jgi:hypothetical protein
MSRDFSKGVTAFLLVAIMMTSMVMVFNVPAHAATEEEIEDAIALGVEYLVGEINPDGSWGPWEEVKVAYTGLVLVKLQMRAYELGYDSPFDPAYPYSDHTIVGWYFVFDNAVKQELSLQDHTGGASGMVDDPDTNGNGYGIFFPGYEVYSTGIVLMALHASGTPDLENFLGIDFDGDGFADTFQEIAQDAADWLAWAQGDSGNDEGGWGYAPLDNQIDWNGWTDNSNGGYAVLGLAAAEGFGCTVPDWVRTELNVWIMTIQDTSGGADDGGSYYNPDWGATMVNELKAGNLIFQMTFYGDALGVPRFDAAMDYIERHWQDMNNDPGWGYNQDPANYQAMFCLMKGFEYSRIELIDLNGDDIPEHDWYDEFTTVLVNQQNPDGSWYMGEYGDAVIDTAWALLTLEKAAPPPPVIIVFVDIKPGSWPNPFNQKSKGVLPVAICGTEDFDVTTIDPATIQLTREGIEEGVSPLRWSYEDVATPYTGEPCGGHDLNGDGYLDLSLKFENQEVYDTLGLEEFKGETLPLVITGNLKEEHDGTPIRGEDCVWILDVCSRSQGSLGHMPL